nr:unnamed protein product [Digitaria exilis]
MAQCDHELIPLEASITKLKVLMRSTDDQIPHIGAEKSVLQKKKTELQRSLWAEFDKVNKEQSDLGAGYADYQFPHQA